MVQLRDNIISPYCARNYPVTYTVNEECFLIAIDWFERYKASQEKPTSPLSPDEVGKVNNESLLLVDSDGYSKLRPGLIMDHDCVAIPRLWFDNLTVTYGLVDPTHILKVKAIETGDDYFSDVRIELYCTSVTIICFDAALLDSIRHSGNVENSGIPAEKQFKVDASAETPISTIIEKTPAAFKSGKFRLWCLREACCAAPVTWATASWQLINDSDYKRLLKEFTDKIEQKFVMEVMLADEQSPKTEYDWLPRELSKICQNKQAEFAAAREKASQPVIEAPEINLPPLNCPPEPAATPVSPKQTTSEPGKQAKPEVKEAAPSSKPTSKPANVGTEKQKTSTASVGVQTKTPGKPQPQQTADRSPKPVSVIVPFAAKGIKNTNNLCYMNSTLQCVMHVKSLVDYFLGSQSSTHASGQGTVMNTFVSLLRWLWSNENTPATANAVRQAIAVKKPYLTEGDQHDAHECLTFLLELIHEECKQLPSNASQASDGDGRVDDDEKWRNYLSLSIIAELFHGQTRTTIECVACGGKSFNFEPFTCLSLPVPDNRSYHIQFIYVPYSGNIVSHKKYVSFWLSIRNDMTFSDLYQSACWKLNTICQNLIVQYQQRQAGEIVSLWEQLKPDDLLLYTVSQVSWRHRRLPQNGQPRCWNEKCCIYAFELDRVSSNSSKKHSYALVSLSDKVSYCRDYGTFLLRFDEQLLNGSFKQLIVALVERVTTLYPNLFRSALVPVSIDNFFSYFNLFAKFSGHDAINVTATFSSISTDASWLGAVRVFNAVDVPLDFENALNYLERFTLEPLIDADYTGFDIKFTSADYFRVDNRADLPIDDSQIFFDLHRCLEMFCSPEELGPDNKRECLKCKKKAEARTWIQLCRLPPVLIVHLKRFVVLDQNNVMKNETVIAAPFDGLDLSNYMILSGVPASSDRAVLPADSRGRGNLYKLIAICQHTGNVHEGHYISYCRDIRSDQNQWYVFDDDRVFRIPEAETDKAYLLVYQRENFTVASGQSSYASVQ